MKKLMLTLLVFVSTASVVAQKEYAKLNKDELIKALQTKDKEIKILNDKLADEKKANEKSAYDNEKSSDTKASKLRKAIKETNAAFLREIFVAKYIDKRSLFENDLENEDNSVKIKKSDIIARNLMLDDTNEDISSICQKVLDFNLNYSKLYEVKTNVLSEKYNVKKVKEALADIRELPELDRNSKLDLTKEKIIRYLENYNDNTCKLKLALEKLMLNPDQNPTFKLQYTKLETKEEFKDYPYLLEVIKRVKNNKADYSKNDLQPCEDTILDQPAKTKTTEKTTPSDANGKKKAKN